MENSDIEKDVFKCLYSLKDYFINECIHTIITSHDKDDILTSIDDLNSHLSKLKIQHEILCCIKNELKKYER